MFDEAASQLVKISVATGSAGPTVRVPAGWAVKAVSADGSRVALMVREGGGVETKNNSIARVFSIGGGGGPAALTKVAEIQPFAEPKKDAQSPVMEIDRPYISSIEFVDDDHVLFRSNKLDVVLVDVPHNKAVWSAKAWGLDSLAVSPGGRQVVLPSERGKMCLVDTMTGNVLGVFDNAEGTRWGYFRFSDDGRFVAAYYFGSLRIWDVATGRIVTTVFVHHSSERLDWLGNDYTLLDGSRLIDLKKSLVLWRYADDQHAAPPGFAVGGRYWYLFGEMKGGPGGGMKETLVPVTLPDPQVVQTVAAMKPEDLYAVSPGTKVKVSVNVGGADAAKLTASLSDALRKAGLVPAEDGQVRLEASSSAGESRTVHFRPFGAPLRGGQDQTATTTTTKLRVAMIGPDGRSLWERGTTTGGFWGGMITLKEGQSVQQAMEAQSKPDVESFFKGVTVPSYLAKAVDGMGVGTSSLGAKGVGPATSKK